MPLLEAKGIDAELVIYVLQGGDISSRRALQEIAGEAAHRVIDIAQPDEAASFAEEVRDVGTSGRGQGELVLT